MQADLSGGREGGGRLSHTHIQRILRSRECLVTRAEILIPRPIKNSTRPEKCPREREPWLPVLRARFVLSPVQGVLSQGEDVWDGIKGGYAAESR